MSLELSVYDAATNCQTDGATAIVTLKSGVVLTGRPKKPVGSLGHDRATVHMKTATGWVTALSSEIASIEATR